MGFLKKTFTVLYCVLCYFTGVAVMNATNTFATSFAFISWSIRNGIFSPLPQQEIKLLFVSENVYFCLFSNMRKFQECSIVSASSGLRKTLKLSLFSRLTKRLRNEPLKSDFTIDLKHEVCCGLFG